jgi:hypothetical protein
MSYFDQIDFLYKKPDVICRSLSDADKQLLGLSKDDFVNETIKDLENAAAKHNLSYRVADKQDIYAINEFIESRYIRLEGNELSPYDYYRFIKYGHCLLLEHNHTIKGVVFEIAYDTPEKTSYPLRLVLDDSIKGFDFGRQVVLYLSMLAIKRGARVNRSVISFDNYKSLFIQVNKQGWILTGYNPQIKGLTPYFEACLPLSKHGILSNKIDLTKVLKFIEENKEEKDYKLISVNDSKGLQKAFNNDFVMVAMISKGLAGNQETYFALPKQTIKYQ